MDIFDKMFGTTKPNSKNKSIDTTIDKGKIALRETAKTTKETSKKVVPFTKKVGSGIMKIGEYGASLNFGQDDFNFDMPFGNPTQGRETATQRVEKAKLREKARSIVKKYGVSEADAIEYLRTHPHEQTQSHKHKPHPQKSHHPETESQRLARERKRYDQLRNSGLSGYEAMRKIEAER